MVLKDKILKKEMEDTEFKNKLQTKENKKKELKERLSNKINLLKDKQVESRERLLKAEEIIQNYEDKGNKLSLFHINFLFN